MIILRNGWQNIIVRMNAVHSKQHVIDAHIFGPHNSAPRTKGFQDHCSLPTGGGRNGLPLGSFRAPPAGIATALSFGQICKEIKSEPIGVILSVLWSFLLNFNHSLSAGSMSHTPVIFLKLLTCSFISSSSSSSCSLSFFNLASPMSGVSSSPSYLYQCIIVSVDLGYGYY